MATFTFPHLLPTIYPNKIPPFTNVIQPNLQFIILVILAILKMTGGTPEVRSDKSLTLKTLNIQHSTNGPMDQRTNGPMDQWTNGPMDQWNNGPMDQWTNGPMDQWSNGPMVPWS